ncbi:MAG: ABC transporter ATP-binding protein [Actinomycetota bacterium]|nr:ABC transporter ATP-binding protein [Actinomycetota bacterium]
MTDRPADRQTGRRPARRSTPKRRPPAFRLDGIERTYGGALVLGPIDLRIEAGESVALVGHNGSGKSTTLAIMAGQLEPTDGRITVYSREPDALESRGAVAYLPDQPILYDDLSVREHVDYVARLHGVTGDEARDRRVELVERLGLADRIDDLPSRFSRGLRQKTAIAVALCRPLRALLVDEPFVGLDADGRATFVELLAETAAAGAAVVVATHEPAVLERFDRCIGIDAGDLTFDGAPAELPDTLRAAPRR